MRTSEYPCTHILIPYDGSPSARGALETAALLCRAHAGRVAQVTLLRVVGSGYLARHVHNVDLRVLKMEQTSQWQRLRQRYLDQEVLPTLEEARQFLEIKGVTASIATRVVDGKIGQTLLQFADREGVSTICMGRRGLSSFQEFFLGSVTREVLNAARGVSVYIAGQPRSLEAEFSLFPALIPVDGSEMSLQAVREAALVAQGGPPGAARITLLHVVDLDLIVYDLPDDLTEHMLHGQKILDTAAHILQNAGLAGTWEEKLLSGVPAKVIAQEAETGDYGAVFMGHRGLSPLANFVLGSVATNVLHRVEHPTLALVYG